MGLLIGGIFIELESKSFKLNLNLSVSVCERGGDGYLIWFNLNWRIINSGDSH